MYRLGEAGQGLHAHTAANAACAVCWLPDGCRQGSCIPMCELSHGEMRHAEWEGHGLTLRPF